jgi:uncharacterized protein YndB with AHSA1/START domain
MPTRLHTAEVALPLPPPAVFQLLITPSAIRQWWQAARAIVLPEKGGTWAATWGENEDDPNYITVAKISEFDPPRRLTLTDYSYRAKTGPLPFQADFTTTFTVEPHGRGSLLRVVQDGFPGDAFADDFYAGCERGWRQTLENITAYCRENCHGTGPLAALLKN